MALHFIFGDQLSTSISSLKGINPEKDSVLMCEVNEEATHVKHHKKKLVFIFSSMRHFAELLRKKGLSVHYVALDDPKNTGSFRGELTRFCQNNNVDEIIVTEPSEYRVSQELKSWGALLSCKITTRPDDRFLCSHDEFESFAQGRKQLRMEYFYRQMRLKTGVLMNGTDPEGGQWNYDADNRKVPPAGLEIPPPFKQKPNSMTKNVMAMVEKYFEGHFGDIQPFHYAVTRRGALSALKSFISERLSLFGDYQDAMQQNEPWMFHAHIGLYLNIGLLTPLECIQSAEAAYQTGSAPLNAVEGFIRQIMGWREYIRGIYWLKMPKYVDMNHLKAKRPLPDFYWTGETKMNCLSQCVKETKENAYAHHIQRLMVLGNFALIAGLDPKAVNDWFWVVYADAYQWVELPNVSGMVLFADGGLLASKPYASGGNYINKMSNYCKSCSYKVSVKEGESACPFNYLYWDFLVRNREQLQKNPRVAMMYRTYDRLKDEKKAAIASSSESFLTGLEHDE